MYPGQTETPQRNWDDFSVEFHFLDEREKVRITGKLFDRPTQHVKPTKQTSKSSKSVRCAYFNSKETEPKYAPSWRLNCTDLSPSKRSLYHGIVCQLHTGECSLNR